MLTKVRKWGNSLAIRIPKSFAMDARIENESLVEVSLEDGKIIIKPANPPKWTLEALLERVNEDNLHEEIDTGPSIGHEVW